MVSSMASLALALSVASTGGLFRHEPGGRITPPGPGYGWGFPNGNPDGFGYVDYGSTLPLGANRTPDYFFRRYFALPASQVFFPTYYNPYLTRGQRYLPFSGCGGEHPAGGPPFGSAEMPMHPYTNVINTQPLVEPPPMSGRVEAPPIAPGGSGLIP